MLSLTLTERARLRLLEERDAAELCRLIESDREHLAPWMPWATAGQTEAEALQFIRLTRRQLADNNGIQTAIEIDGALAGMIGVHGISWENGSTTIGYWLAERYEGQGLMTAAVRAYVEHAFTGWGLHRVALEAAVDNRRSRALAQRLGFRQEGVRRQAERVGERHHDLVLYAVLADEWRG